MATSTPLENRRTVSKLYHLPWTYSFQPNLLVAHPQTSRRPEVRLFILGGARTGAFQQFQKIKGNFKSILCFYIFVKYTHLDILVKQREKKSNYSRYLFVCQD